MQGNPIIDAAEAIALEIKDGLDSIDYAICHAFGAESDPPEINLVSAMIEVSENAKRIANAITPTGVADGKDATGGTVASLTEAVMGVTAGLVQIASAIESLADAVRDRK